MTPGGAEEVGFQALSKHLAHRVAPRSVQARDRDDGHALNLNEIETPVWHQTGDMA